MRDKRIVSRDSETHRYDQLADGFQVLAEKQLTRIDRMIHHHSQLLSPLRLSKQFSAVLGRERLHFLDECDLRGHRRRNLPQEKRLATFDGCAHERECNRAVGARAVR